MKRPGSLRSGSGPRRSRAIARGSGPRPAPIDRRRKRRTVSEFSRVYGSRKRVAWIKARPCVVPFCPGSPCENAHVATGGMGRKADSTYIVPLCTSHHRELHNSGLRSFEAKYGVVLSRWALWTEQDWQAWLAHVGAAAA